MSELKDYIQEEMKSVIETSKMIRDFFIDRETKPEYKKRMLNLYKQSLDANKNIVSAVTQMMSVEKISNNNTDVKKK